MVLGNLLRLFFKQKRNKNAIYLFFKNTLYYYIHSYLQRDDSKLVVILYNYTQQYNTYSNNKCTTNGMGAVNDIR